ncbi:MAG TPA: hypothetical protein VFU32_09520, partial [Ktedonobacterales bacterium]|nr:hypothetical protein [Ktedonobacterales bacterium]
MGRQFWQGALATGAGGVILVIEILAFFLAGAQSSIMLIAGYLVIAIICLILGEVRFGFAWRALGCIALSTVVLSAMIWQNVSLWWWPFGLVALGLVYLALADLFPANTLSGWREALAFSAPFVA